MTTLAQPVPPWDQDFVGVVRLRQTPGDLFERVDHVPLGHIMTPTQQDRPGPMSVYPAQVAAYKLVPVQRQDVIGTAQGGFVNERGNRFRLAVADDITFCYLQVKPFFLKLLQNKRGRVGATVQGDDKALHLRAVMPYPSLDDVFLVADDADGGDYHGWNYIGHGLRERRLATLEGDALPQRQ